MTPDKHNNNKSFLFHGHFILFFDLTADGLSEDEKYAILREHNMLRQQVAMGQISGQPGASNMQEMEWDEGLARRAQQWASQCIYEHDPNRFDGEYLGCACIQIGSLALNCLLISRYIVLKVICKHTHTR